MKCSIKYFVSLIILMVTFTLFAEGAFTKGDIIVKTRPSLHEGRVVLQSIENIYDTTVRITFINEYEKDTKRKSEAYFLKKGEKQKLDVTFNAIMAQPVNSDVTLEVFRAVEGKQTAMTENNSDKLNKNHKKDFRKESKKNDSKKKTKSDVRVEENQPRCLSADTVISGFFSYMNSIPFISSWRHKEDSVTISRHVANLNLPSIDKAAYIEDERIEVFIKNFIDSIAQCQSDSSRIIAGYFSQLGKVEKRDSCEKVIHSVYRERVEKRSAIIAPLKLIVDENHYNKDGINWKILVVCGGGVLLCLLLIIWYRKVNRSRQVNKKEMAGKSVEINTSSSVDETPSLVVVGSKSVPVLKKQTLDDIYGNESYLKIETENFCSDSMVRALYIKNSCIKEIYNMYAEDLRNPDNPKEDGCMVIGRWIYDEKLGKYDVSLEHTVLPGDDAVFAEYELNFGGKIKLKMSEKLRKLRRDTGLQYDLTCWVHSHPGLGVFFSSSDNNVHHQLKHPSYSGFLTAFVIDILTPQQDMGIFTFKDTEVVNSKNDLTKLYSLEEMYKWALASERRSFDTNDYFDILGDARTHHDLCYGVQLSNSAIIDMTFLTSKPNGFYGFAHGYRFKRGERTQCVVSVVNGNESAPNTNMLGCFVVASHCSIPSIRKVIFRYLRDIHFVLVYTVSDGLLTAIPIIDNDLVNNETYYGEKKLEDLKIWTRRRR